MPDRAAEFPIQAVERVSDPAQPWKFSADWLKNPSQMAAPDRATNKGEIALPTVHLNNDALNVKDNYSVDSPVAQVYLKNKAAIVRINTLDKRPDGSVGTSTGSGSIVDSSGIISTGYHVVKDANSMRIQVDNGKVYEAKILAVDPSKDQALLQIQRNNNAQEFPTVVLASDSKIVTPSEKLVALGFPLNEENLHVSRLAAEKRYKIGELPITGGLLPGEDPKREVIRSEGPVMKGNSGGPAFDENTGEQIGTVNLKDGGSTYITPIEDLRAFIASTKAKYGFPNVPEKIPATTATTIGNKPYSSHFSSPFGNSTGTGWQNLDKVLQK